MEPGKLYPEYSVLCVNTCRMRRLLSGCASCARFEAADRVDFERTHFPPPARVLE